MTDNLNEHSNYTRNSVKRGGDISLKTEDQKIIDKELTVKQDISLSDIDVMFAENKNLGLENITAEDLPTPTLTLIQNNSTLQDEEGRPYPRGQFYYKGTKEVFKEVNCSLLTFDKKDMPDFSNKEVSVKTYIFMGALEPGYKPFLLYLKRSGIGAAKQYLADVVAKGLPMFALKTKLVSEKVDGEKGSYYKIKFEITGVRDDAQELMMLEKLTRKYATQDKGELEVDSDIPF